MKNERSPKATTVKKQDHAGSKKPASVNVDTTGVTGKIRAHAGRGLSNEGTNVSYDDQSRNDR